MKKHISIFLSVIFVIYLTVPGANALYKDFTDVTGVTKALQQAEELKSELGFSDINFDKLTFSDSIIAYEYTDSGFVYNSEFIPIKDNNRLVGWVIKADNNGEAIYQFSNAFIGAINNYIDIETEFAIIYDYNHCYAYDGSVLYVIGNVSLNVAYRSSIEDFSEVDFSEIELGNYENTYTVHYRANNTNSRSSAYISCRVSFVSQMPPSNMCWAASTACIVNYLLGYNFSAETVARYWYGTNYNRLLDSSYFDDVLNSYGLNYSYRIRVPGDSVMYSNINRGYPMLAAFTSTSSAHAVVVYGINITGGYIVIMDPEFGSARANYSLSNGYTYISDYAGTTLSFHSAACNSWSA